MWKHSEARLLCNKFDFEVPLEDLYPTNYLHPKIRVMYVAALRHFQKNNISSDILLSSKNEDPQSKIDLKEKLLNNKHPKLEGSPQTFLWLIEHFLGLLPISVLASYSNGYYFNWSQLSLECKGIFHDRNYKRKNLSCNYHDKHLQNEIAKLPSQHKLLLNEHIEFMRNISFLGDSKRGRNVIYYSKYFTACLLLRPFRSGLNGNLEENYYFLILYMVLRWPYINKTLVESPLMCEIRESDLSELVQSSDSIEIQGSFKNKTDIEERSSSSSDKKIDIKSTNIRSSSASSIPHDIASRISDKFSSMSLSVGDNFVEKDMNEKKKIKKYKESKHDKIDIHQISENITPNNDMKKDVNASKDIIKPNEYHLEHSSKGKRQEKDTNPDEETKSNTNIEKEMELKETSQKNGPSPDETAKGENCAKKYKNENSTEVDVEIHVKPEKMDSHSTPEVTCKNAENITIDTHIMKRISKLGWTYTPPKHKDRSPNVDNFTKNVSDDKITNQELIDGSQSESTLKKYPSVKSFKSRLSFLKIKRKKRGNMTAKTNFKYTKINS